MKKLIYLFLTVLIVACSSEVNNNDGNNNNQSSCNGDNPVYLDDNGVTIKAYECAEVGDTGVVNGVTYTVVDEAMLREMIANEEDVTKAVTTLVTDMFELFFIWWGAPPSDFNQNISSWDVSNVTTMKYMFTINNEFNQDLSSWDVSNVTDMSQMFEAANSFNQPIGNWDVSNVTDMSEMFNDATAYNQDLSSWSVDGVKYCSSFSNQATSWTLPQPNFTNCDPN